MSVLEANKFRNVGLFLIVVVAFSLVISKLNVSSPMNTGVSNEPVGSVDAKSVQPPSGGGKAQQPNIVQDNYPAANSTSVVYGKFSGTKAQIDELNQWRLERGYMPPNSDKEQNAYNAYTEEALRSLAKNGDVVALHVLADRYLDLEYMQAHEIDVLTSSRVRRDFLTDAAIRGSTRALMELGIDYGAEHRNISRTDDEKKAAEIEVLAIYKVATLRGDPDHFIDELRVSKSIRGIEITDADKQHIDLRAKEIYADLQAKRKDMGLDDFDNSVPETVKNYYESKYGKNY
ncbi:MAG TPA: hypothetical protein PK002_03630 [Cellvibrio sp.]|nr:hypothetical protein [Cellvibrio sp.]